MKKINVVLNVWKNQAPDATFAEMTQAEFEAAMKPVLDAQQRLKDLALEMEVCRKQLANLSAEGYDVSLRVVDGVKANPAYGNNSPVYAAMGYIAKLERQSGRTWKTKAAQAETLKTGTEK